jgi:hypothetical protein
MKDFNMRAYIDIINEANGVDEGILTPEIIAKIRDRAPAVPPAHQRRRDAWADNLERLPDRLRPPTRRPRPDPKPYDINTPPIPRPDPKPYDINTPIPSPDPDHRTIQEPYRDDGTIHRTIPYKQKKK